MAFFAKRNRRFCRTQLRWRGCRGRFGNALHAQKFATHLQGIWISDPKPCFTVRSATPALRKGCQPRRAEFQARHWYGFGTVRRKLGGVSGDRRAAKSLKRQRKDPGYPLPQLEALMEQSRGGQLLLSSPCFLSWHWCARSASIEGIVPSLFQQEFSPRGSD
jgi:hypothetical protein